MTRVRCETINETVERIARWIERDHHNKILATITVGRRGGLARAIRDTFSDNLAE